MGKKKIVLIALLIAILLLITYIVIDYVYPQFGLIPDWIFPAIYDFFASVFYVNNLYFLIGTLVLNLVFGSLFGIGYSMTKRNRVRGTIIYLFGLDGIIGLILAAIFYYFLGIVFAADISVPLKLTFVAVYTPLLFLFFLILEAFYDVSSFLVDVVKQRHEYKKLGYRVHKIKEEKVNFIEVYRKTEDSKVKSLFEAAPQLMLEEALYTLKDDAVSRFVKSAITNIFLMIAAYLTGWRSAKIRLYRFIGAKIGKHCMIAQYCKLDPFMPNMVIMEDYSAVAMEVMLLAHSYLDREGVMGFRYGPIRICSHARVGVRCTILAGVTIGEGAVVAANSLVTKDVEPWTMVGGVPAKPIRKLERTIADSLDRKQKESSQTGDDNIKKNL